jgi:hypothetical protein
VKEQIEDILRALGATHVEVRFGDDAYIAFKDLQGEPEGWEVIDNRRRYPRSAGASLDLETAARYAKQMGRQREGWSVPTKGDAR